MSRPHLNPSVSHVLSLLGIGAASLIWQVSSARSVMAGLYGNELTLGMVLASWLLLMGGSTALTARLFQGGAGSSAGPAEAPGPGLDRRRSLALCAVLLLFPVAVLGSLGLQQLTLPAFTSVGLVPGPARALGSALLCLLPPCLMLGAGFGLISLYAPAGVSPARWAAWIYLWESLGTVLGGVVFHIWLADLSLALLGLWAALLPWSAGLMMLASSRGGIPRRGGGPWLPMLALAGALAMAYLFPPFSLPGQARLLEARLPGYAQVELRNTRHGALAVLRRGDQVIFCQNGIPVFSNQDQQLIQTDIHLTLLMHPRPRQVLLIGGGLGGGLTEVLRHPVVHLDYVELDPLMIQLARRWGDAGQIQALSDPRVRLMTGDGRQVVAAAGERPGGTYDMIVLGLPGPSSALINRFYTEEFFQRAREALRPGGMIRVSLGGSETYLGHQQALLHSTVRAAMLRSFRHLAVLPGQTTLLLGSDAYRPALDPEVLLSRMARRGLHSDFLGEMELADRLLPFKRAAYEERVAEVQPLSNTDLRPSAYFQSTLHWLSLNSPRLAHSMDRLARWSSALRWQLVVVALVLALAAGALLRRRSAEGAAAVALAGFSGMVVELSLVLACQEQRGVIYHEVGALMTAFMAGLAAGARVGAYLAGRFPDHGLRLSLWGCSGASLLGLLVMSLPSRGSSLTLLMFLAVLGLLGLAVGACYAPAAGKLAQRLGSGVAAARSYAWDLAGAAAGALLASAFVLPVLGLPDTCLLCAALCAGYGAASR